MSVVEPSDDPAHAFLPRSDVRQTRRRLIIVRTLYRYIGNQHTYDAKPAAVLISVAFSLALLSFLSSTSASTVFFGWLNESAISVEWTSAYWVGCRVVCYFLIPVAALVAMGRNPLDCGLRVRGVGGHLPVYGALLLVMAPIVVAVSFSSAFQRYYPFYEYASQSLTGFLLWESLYAMQFVALEFFYRGYMLFTLERYIGAYAVFVMVIPYCMIHFGKPFIETLAAIPAGIVLGLLALKTRSIWPGALVHISVGWSMDLLSLWHRGTLIELVRRS